MELSQRDSSFLIADGSLPGSTRQVREGRGKKEKLLQAGSERAVPGWSLMPICLLQLCHLHVLDRCRFKWVFTNATPGCARAPLTHFHL